MPVEVSCPQCRRRFRAPDKYLGKRVKCPRCAAGIDIPKPAPAPTQDNALGFLEASTQPDSQPAQSVDDALAADAGSPSMWYLQIEDGQQYGPVSWHELAGWAAQGRVTSECQVLQEGWEQWKWASEVFPELAAGAADGVAGRAVETSVGVAAESDPIGPTDPSSAATSGEELPFASAGATTSVETGFPWEEPGQVEPVPTSSGQAAKDIAATHENLELTPAARKSLKDTRPWVVFLAALGLVVGGVGTLVGLAVLILGAATAGVRGAVAGLMAIAGPAVSMILAYHLFAYGRRIETYLFRARAKDLESALLAQKTFWQMAGIIAAALLVLYMLMGIVLALLGFQAMSAIADVTVDRARIQ